MEISLPCATELEIVPVDLALVFCEKRERSRARSQPLVDGLSGNSPPQWLPGWTSIGDREKN